MSQDIRVLHCPTAVAGHPAGLARAERAVGLDSRSVALEPGPYGFVADEVLAPRANPWLRELKRWGLLSRAIRWADVVHFNFGSTILPHRIDPGPEARAHYPSPFWWAYNAYATLVEQADLPVLRRRGKGIVVTFQGSDARQGDACRSLFATHPADEVEPGYYSPRSDVYKRERISRFDRYADHMFALNPDLLHVLPPRARFMPYASVDPREWRPDPPKMDRDAPLVLHAPSHRGVKGTRYILDAVSRLRRRGVQFEFRIVEGVPHAEARRLYQSADLLVDQLLCGWYGSAAVEFMALGKPVVCYIRADDLKFIPDEMRASLPIVRATPETVCDVLQGWLTKDPQERAEVGRRSRAFVERWHDPIAVARNLKEHYEAILDGRGA